MTEISFNNFQPTLKSAITVLLFPNDILSLQVQLLVGVSILEVVQPLRVLQPSQRRQAQSNDNRQILRRILENLAGTKLYLTNDISAKRRHITTEEMGRSRNIYEAIAKNKQALRQGKIVPSMSVTDNIAENHHYAKLVENELKATIHKKSSALLDRPTMEKKGNNDFLVFQPKTQDMYVTVIPNNIYYNIEKKCVNWLDECSLKGIQEKLLQRDHSPFK